MAVTIALIIPTYNRSKLIEETVLSALNQLDSFSEIIVVDDGSTDNTIEVLEPYLDRIKVIRILNGGVQTARNRGVEHANSEYITFCDSDDLLEPHFVSVIKAWLSSSPRCQAVYTNFRHFSDNSVGPDNLSQAPKCFLEGAKQEKAFMHEIPDLYLRLFTVHPFYIIGCTVKKSFFISVGAFNPIFNGVGAEDGEFTLRVAASTSPAYCTEPIARVRRHPGNESSNPMHMIVGSAEILEYASKNHSNISQFYRAALVKESSKLRIDAGNRAFSMGKFELAEKMFSYKLAEPLSWKHQLKKAIVNSPEPLRKFAWKVSQFRLNLR